LIESVVFLILLLAAYAIGVTGCVFKNTSLTIAGLTGSVLLLIEIIVHRLTNG